MFLTLYLGEEGQKKYIQKNNMPEFLQFIAKGMEDAIYCNQLQLVFKKK